MLSRFRKHRYRALSALICAAAILTAGCHRQNNISYYGIAWVTLTDEPGDFTSYIVTIDTITLTRNDGLVVTAVGTPEIVDLTQLSNVAELWSSGAIPTGTYTSATITLDYTNASISAMVNGVAQTARVVDAYTDVAPTTYAVTVNFDADQPMVITNTYASTSAQRLMIDIDLAASNRVDLSVSPVLVYVKPFVTVGVLPADTKLTRVRGPLINSSVDVDTYTVYIRPFYDEANNIGTITMFSQDNTVYTINGNTYVGAAGLNAISLLSAGSTMTAAYTTFQPDYNALNAASAGKFNMVYVIGASTLEDVYTEGISGDVTARSGNTLTLQGSTLFLNTADTFTYEIADTYVLVGPKTIVTADDNTTLKNLDYNSIAVGQHITARGIYGVLADGTTQIDATGTQSTNTGSVRLQPTELWGSLVSSASGSLVLDLQTINNWPAGDYHFKGNGPTAPVASAFAVDTGTLAPPAGTAAGDPLWLDGFFTPFGSAPPDFDALAVNNESSVQLAGGILGGGAATSPGVGDCGLGSQVCDPASLQVVWTVAGTSLPFSVFSATGLVIDLANTHLASAVIRIGPESIALKSLPSSPLLVSTSVPITSTFSPRFVFGNPHTATTTTAITSTTKLSQYHDFADFVAGLNKNIDADNLVEQLTARGIYDRAANTFTATSIDVVL